MPMHKTHLAIAKKVNETLKMDEDAIMLGSILPDITKEKNHANSHYQKGIKDLEGLANPDEFLKDNIDLISNPVIMGCLIHILSDRFYNEFMFKNFYVYDENDNGIGLKINNKVILMDNEKRKYYKHRDLIIYDKWLLNHNCISKFNSIDCINKIVNLKTCSWDKEEVKKYIISTNKDIDKVNIFSKLTFYNYKLTNQKTLDKLFNDCVDYIINYLKNNKLI
jgi:hypothetical protein